MRLYPHLWRRRSGPVYQGQMLFGRFTSSEDKGHLLHHEGWVLSGCAELETTCVSPPRKTHVQNSSQRANNLYKTCCCCVLPATHTFYASITSTGKIGPL